MGQTLKIQLMIPLKNFFLYLRGFRWRDLEICEGGKVRRVRLLVKGPRQQIHRLETGHAQ